MGQALRAEFDSGEGPQRHASLSLRKLLYAYLILPIAFLTVLVDHFFLSGALARRLPFSPEQVLFFSLFFVLPHIFASANQFFDREYLRYYQRPLLLGIPIILLGTWFAPLWLGWDFYLMIFGLYTMYHVIGQQFGLVKLSLKRVDWVYHAWKWLGITVGFLIYAALYPVESQGFQFSTWAIQLAHILLPFWIFFAWRVGRDTRNRLGFVYVWANQIMLILALLFFEMGYPFFSILVPRVVHDVTAFLFYMVHDYNRNATATNNKLFLWVKNRPVFLPYATGLLAVFVALPFTLFESSHFLVAYFVYVISTFHYFTESFVWRSNSIHRQSIFFSELKSGFQL